MRPQKQLTPRRKPIGKENAPTDAAKPPPIRVRKDGSGERKKKWAPRAKTGCMTCRIRRVKCNEARPSCSQCISTRRVCDGYANPSGPQAAPAEVARSPDYSHSPPGVQLGRSESRMFYMFRNETVKHVAGVFDYSFWATNVLRAARVYPAIWHASLAVAAIQERNLLCADDVQSQDLRRRFYGFALIQYNAAIKLLLEIATKPTQSAPEQETLLMASLLFTTLSILQSDGSQTLAHANNGIELFNRWRYWEQAEQAHRTGDRILSPDIFATIITLTTQQFHCDRLTLSPWALRKLLKHVACAAEFESPSDAFRSLEPMLTGMLEILRGLNPDTDQIQQHYMMRETQKSYRVSFAEWKEKFSSLMEMGTLSDGDQWAMTEIKALSIGLSIALKIDLDDMDMEFDGFYSSFEQIIVLAETLSATEDRGPKQWGFSFSHSLCQLLFFVCTSCRDSTLRRRAVALMRALPTKMSYVYSLTARLCEAIMEAEEMGGQNSAERDEDCRCDAGKFICREHRVVFRHTEVVSHGEIVVEIRTTADLKRNRPGKVAQLSFS